MARDSISIAHRRILAGELLKLVAAGVTVAEAAAKLEIPERTAYRWYQREMQSYYQEHVKEREILVGRELRTLDLLQRKMLGRALAGDNRSAEIVLQIMDRRSKMLGLDAAAKVQVEVGRVNEAVKKIVDIIDGQVVAVDQLARAELPVAAP